jgi:hypothetical protein
MDWAPILMVTGFLMFGVAFVLVSDGLDWLKRRKR